MSWWWWLVVRLVVWGSAGALALLWCLWASRPRVDVPGPPALPIVGNTLHFWKVPITIAKLRDLHRQYGDLTRFYFGPTLVLMVVHPDDVQHILLTCKLVDRDPFTSRIVRIFAGNSLFTLNGRPWKVHRKLVNPTFHAELLDSFLGAFHQGGLFLSDRLAGSRGLPTEVHPPVFLAALRTIYKTAIGVDPDAMIPNAMAEDEMSAAMRGILATFQAMLGRPWLQSRLALRATASGRRLYRYVRLLRQLATPCIALRAAATQREATTRPRLLEALVSPGGSAPLPLAEVRDELLTMKIASAETTSVTVGFVLALLALHPEWQDAARRELREVFGEGAGEGDDHLPAPSTADLNKLTVLDSIIKEALRLFPVVPAIPRVAPEDLWLSGGRVFVPRGARLAIVPYLTHRLPEFFPEPLRFDPSRFLEGGGRQHPGSYVPFGLGARNCVGFPYARLQLRVFVAHVLWRFRLLPHASREELEDLQVSVSMHTVRPIRVACVPLRDNRAQGRPQHCQS